MVACRARFLLPAALLSVIVAATATATPGPCDLYALHGTPCVAAHSTTRALFGGYAGALFAVKRARDNATMDIKVVAPGGLVDSASLASFCGPDHRCTVELIYDQTPLGNHIAAGSGRNPLAGTNATGRRLVAGAGHTVFAAMFEGKMGYRNDTAAGVATGDEPESMYMVVDGHHYNDQCCFDYGNAERNIKDDGTGSMEAVYFGNASGGSMNHGGAGKGPWIQADMEKGLWSGNTTNTGEPAIVADFVTAILKGGPGRWALKGGDAGTAGPLTTFYDGARPSEKTAGHSLPGGGIYNPMRKQGGLILGVGGDNSDGGTGTFLEGAITRGFATDAADEAVQANVVAVGYRN